MHNKLDTVVAGQKKDELDPEIWRVLSDLGYVEQKSISAVGFCRSEEGRLLVVLPKAFTHPAAKQKLDSDKDYKEEQVFRLIRVFKKIQNDTRYAQHFIDSTSARGARHRSLDPVLDSVEAAIRIRAEYRRNGLWVPRGQARIANNFNHPVSWAATIKTSAPIFDESSLFFLHTLHDRRANDSSNLFYRLHIHILRDIFTRTGEKHRLSDLPNYDDSALKPVLRNPIRYLRAFRREIFTDRGRALLSYFEAYLNTRSLEIGRKSQTDDCLSYTATFENLWEFILAELFRPEAKPAFPLKTGKWISWPEKRPMAGITPEADLVLEKPVLTIIDAKDYRIFNGSPLLGTRLGDPSDHYKQVIYRTLLETKSGEPATNILAFPSVEQKSLFLLNGCHYWDNLEKSPVFEICVDYNLAVRRWLGEIRLDVASEFEKLSKEIAILQASLKPSE